MAHVLEFDQVNALLRAMRDEDLDHWLMAAVAFNHCLRPAEVVGGWAQRKNRETNEVKRWRHPGLTPANIVGTRLCGKRMKGSKAFDDELLVSKNPLLNERDALFELARRTPRNQRLFPMSTRTFQRLMHYYGEKAGVPKKWAHPHTLKHSILDHLRLSGMRLEELQDRSGHVSLDSLRVYLHPKKTHTDRLVHDALQN